MKDLKHRSDEEPGGKEAQGRPYHTLQLPEKRLLKGGWLLIPGNLRQDEKKWPQAAPGEVQAGHQEELLHGKSCEAFEQAAQGSCGVTIAGGVPRNDRT